VTVGHPDGGVTPDTFREHAHGFVRSQGPEPERLGAHEFVRANLQINVADTIGKLGSDLVECSCAYTADKDWTPGVTADGEEYDVVFRGLAPNHVALGPAGFARAGREARLIADGESEMDQLTDNTLIADDSAAPLKTPAQSAGDRDQLVADAALLRDENARLTKDLESARGALAAAETKRDALQAQVDGLPKAIADGVTAELAFRKKIADRLPKDYAFEGKDSRQIKVDAIKHCNPKVVVADDASAEWLDAFLDGMAAAPVTEHDHNETHGGNVVQDGTPTESVYAKKSRAAFAAKDR
jgi:hypothetical protein